MTYIIYADRMLIWNTIINFSVLYISLALLNVCINKISAMLWSVLTAFVSTVLYILMINKNIYIHHILYCVSTFFMTTFYIRHKTGHTRHEILLILLVSSFLLNGIISLDIFRLRLSFAPIILLAVILVSKTIKYMLRSIFSMRHYSCRVQILTADKSITCRAYYDTGNTLLDPYTKQPVIIIDCQTAKVLLDDSYSEILDIFYSKGTFPYEDMNTENKLLIHPILYQTISNKQAMIPAFSLKYLCILEENKVYSRITAGISRYEISAKGRKYPVLLNESLKPFREEHSNDYNCW